MTWAIPGDELQVVAVTIIAAVGYLCLVWMFVQMWLWEVRR